MCQCTTYQDLEFERKKISDRIKESRNLKKQLQIIAKHDGKEHKLYRCNECGQYWQGSRAWNLGNDEYLFRIPRIDEEDWFKEVFVQPDELLIYTATVSKFLKENAFLPSEHPCGIQGCKNYSIFGMKTCLKHHVESLQRARMLPSNPSGRWFDPYIKENILVSL